MTSTDLLALDLFCCSGGASEGLSRAGFDISGVDVEWQPEYRFHFTQRDATNFAPGELDHYDLIWASPPCQNDTAYKRRKNHVKPVPQLIPPTREMLKKSGVTYVIENVPGAPLENPITLCGSMFGLDVRRHRIFECSFPVIQPKCNHAIWTPRFAQATNRTNKRKTVEVGVYRIPLAVQQKAMGLKRSLAKLSQAVPPAYAEYLGLQARLHILTQRRAA